MTREAVTFLQNQLGRLSIIRWRSDVDLITSVLAQLVAELARVLNLVLAC